MDGIPQRGDSAHQNAGTGENAHIHEAAFHGAGCIDADNNRLLADTQLTQGCGKILLVFHAVFSFLSVKIAGDVSPSNAIYVTSRRIMPLFLPGGRQSSKDAAKN